MKINRAEEVKNSGHEVLENDFVKIIAKNGYKIDSVASSIKLEDVEAHVGVHAGTMTDLPNRAKEVLIGTAAAFGSHGMSEEDCIRLVELIAKYAIEEIKAMEATVDDKDGVSDIRVEV